MFSSILLTARHIELRYPARLEFKHVKFDGNHGWMIRHGGWVLVQLYTALLMLLDESHLIMASARLCGDLPSYPRSRVNLLNLSHSEYLDLLLVELLISLLVEPGHDDIRCRLEVWRKYVFSHTAFIENPVGSRPVELLHSWTLELMLSLLQSSGSTPSLATSSSDWRKNPDDTAPLVVRTVFLHVVIDLASCT